MIRYIRMHRADDTELIRHVADLGKEVGDFQSTLAFPGKLEGRLERGPGRALRLQHLG